MLKKRLTSDIALLIYIAIAASAGHLAVAGNYGFFLDELYTIACSQHLSLAFVDIPPVAPALLALNTLVFGDSLFALHILPSLFSGAVVVLTGLMARELGGGKFAVVFAGVAAAFVPVWMAVGSLYTYDFLDQLVIVSLFYALLRLIKRENPKTWLWIGGIAGFGLMVKPSMVFFIAALVIGLLLTQHRRAFKTRWPWLGALIGFVIILPALIWQISNSFPVAEYWGAYATGKTVNAGPAEFILMQVVGMNPFLLPVWVTGLIYVLLNKEGKKYRLLGVIFAVLFAVFLTTGAKMYMLIPAYSVLLAAGALSIERFAAKLWKKALMIAYACVIVLTGLVMAPNFMPVLPVDSLITYYDTMGGLVGAKSIRLDNGARVELPQYFYDRFEWDVLVADVAEVYKSLPEEERADTAVVSQNYGWAGAVDKLGSAYGLPNAMCGQLNYYFFSLDDIGKPTWIMIGEDQQSLEAVFGSVTLAKVSETVYRQPHKTPIYICREPKFTPEEGAVGIKKFQ